MKIEAICQHVEVDGIKQPEYLIRVSHREAMALGAKTFELGEQLTLVPTVTELYGFAVSARKLADSMETLAKGIKNE